MRRLKSLDLGVQQPGKREQNKDRIGWIDDERHSGCAFDGDALKLATRRLCFWEAAVDSFTP